MYFFLPTEQATKVSKEKGKGKEGRSQRRLEVIKLQFKVFVTTRKSSREMEGAEKNKESFLLQEKERRRKRQDKATTMTE